MKLTPKNDFLHKKTVYRKPSLKITYKKTLEKVASYSTDTLVLTGIIQTFGNDVLLQPRCYGGSIKKCFLFLESPSETPFMYCLNWMLNWTWALVKKIKKTIAKSDSKFFTKLMTKFIVKILLLLLFKLVLVLTGCLHRFVSLFEIFLPDRSLIRLDS